MLPILSLLLGCGDAVVALDYLTVIHIAPSNGAANIGQETEISATFNDELVRDSWIGSVYLDDTAGNPVPGSLSYDPDGRTLSLLPDAPLERSATYTFTLADTLQGESYGDLPANISTQFRTVGAGLSGGNQRPVALIDDLPDCLVGQPTSLSHSSTDPESDPLEATWRVVSGPEDGVFEVVDAEVDWTVQQPGDYTIGLVVSDGELDSNEAYASLICIDVDVD